MAENWSAEEKRDNLFEWLGDPARSFAIALGNRSYKTLMKRLSKAYGRHQGRDLAQMTLKDMVQESDQSVGDFYAALITQAKYAFDQDDLSRGSVKRLLVSTFLHGLQDGKIAFDVAETKPRDIHEAFDRVKKRIIRKNSFLGPKKSRKVLKAVVNSSESEDNSEEVDVLWASKKTDAEHQIGRIQGMLKTATEKVKSRRKVGKVGPGCCFHCGGEGHLANDCHIRLEDDLNVIKEAASVLEEKVKKATDKSSAAGDDSSK